MVGDTVRTVVGEAVVGSDVEGGVGAMLGDTAAAAVEELVEALVGRSIGLWVGARVAGAKHPQISRKAVTLVLRVASTKPLCPARWKLKHEGGGCPATSTIPSGLVIRTVGSLASQTLQRGKPGKGGSAADTGAAVMGAGVTGAVMAGAGMVGTTVATGATVHGAIHPHAPRTKKMMLQVGGSMLPMSPARWYSKHEAGGCPRIRTIPSGLVIRTVGSLGLQILQGGKGADVGGESLTGAVVMGAAMDGTAVIGAGVTGAGVTGAAVKGADVIGVGVTGAEVTGAAVTGPDVTGAAVIGPDVTGTAVTGSIVATDGAMGTVGSLPPVPFSK